MARLHHIYERLITWAFSGRRYRVFVPPVPAYGFGFGANGQRLTGGKRQPALRDAHPARHRAVVGGATFVAAIGAGHDDRRRGDPADRPGLHQPAHHDAGGHQPGSAPTRR